MSEQHDYDGIKYRDEKGSPRIFTILFTVLVIWGVAFMGHYLFSGWSSQTEADSAGRALSEKNRWLTKLLKQPGPHIRGADIRSKRILQQVNSSTPTCVPHATVKTARERSGRT